MEAFGKLTGIVWFRFVSTTETFSLEIRVVHVKFFHSGVVEFQPSAAATGTVRRFAFFDERVIMAGTGLTTVHDDTDKFVIAGWCARAAKRQAVAILGGRCRSRFGACGVGSFPLLNAFCSVRCHIQNPRKLNKDTFNSITIYLFSVESSQIPGNNRQTWVIFQHPNRSRIVWVGWPKWKARSWCTCASRYSSKELMKCLTI